MNHSSGFFKPSGDNTVTNIPADGSGISSPVAPSPGFSSNALLQENTGYFLLEDGVSKLLLES